MEDSTWCFSMFLVWKIESWFAKAKAHTPNRKSEQPIQITCSESMWLYLSVNISVLISKLCILEFREPSWNSLRKLLMCGHHFLCFLCFLRADAVWRDGVPLQKHSSNERRFFVTLSVQLDWNDGTSNTDQRIVLETPCYGLHVKRFIWWCDSS